MQSRSRRYGHEGRRNPRWAALLAALLLLVAMSSALKAEMATLGVVDGGGNRATSQTYVCDGSLGGIGGVSTAAPAGVVRNGYVGQLYEVKELAVTGTPAQVNEGDVSQFRGLAILDDATIVALQGADINWDPPVYPIATLNSNGLATVASVYSTTTGRVSGFFLAATGSTHLLVTDVNPDNFGIYAGDEIPDRWQVRYFGVDNTNGVWDADPYGTGQNNRYKYVADLNPTNRTSVFAIIGVSNPPASRVVWFLSSTGRVYSLQRSTNVLNGMWADVPGQSNVWGGTDMMSLTDTNASHFQFYRVSVRVP